MADFLLAPWLFVGHLLPHLAVAEALREAGHRVVVYAEPEAGAVIARAGCEHVAISRCDRAAFLKLETEEDAIEAHLAFARSTAPELTDVLASHRFDAALVDSFHLGAALAVTRAALPFATLATTPLETHAEFADSPLHRLPAEGLRHQLGLGDASASSYAQTLSPELVLLPWTTEFDGGIRPARGVLVGPLACKAPLEHEPPWLRDLDPSRPVVVVTISSSPVDALAALLGDYLAAVIEALGQLPVETAVAIGGLAPPARVPANVHVAPLVPHATLVPRAGLVITHGGWGSISRALVHGVPMLVVPFAIDQPLNAQLVERAEVGVFLQPELADVDTVIATVEELLSEHGGPRARARSLAAAIAKLRPAETAARLLAGLARSRPA